MNVLFLSTRSPYPLISGHSLRTYHILRGAAERHGVVLVSFVQLEEELESQNVAHLRQFCREVHLFRVPSDVSRWQLAAGLLTDLLSPLPFVARKYDSEEIRCKIRELRHKYNFDLIHFDMLALTPYLDEFPNLPRVLVNHNVESIRLFRWFKEERRFLKRTFLGWQWLKLRRYEARSIARFDRCVVVSEVDRQLLAAMSPQARLSVIPNGTDTTYFRPDGIAEPNSIIWVGAMDTHANRDGVSYYWHQILPLIMEMAPQATMTFVGKAPLEPIRERAQVDARIRVTGLVPDVRPHVCSAAVFVAPIRIGGGTRLKILDAMAMGKAVVATSVGCEGIEAVDGQQIMVADTPKEFAEKVVRLLQDRKLRERLGAQAREFVKRYDWQIMRQLQEEVYQAVLREHR